MVAESACLSFQDADAPTIALAQDFDKYDLTAVNKSIQTRRTRIFLLMEEVRRLRIEQRVKVGLPPFTYTCTCACNQSHMQPYMLEQA